MLAPFSIFQWVRHHADNLRLQSKIFFDLSVLSTSIYKGGRFEPLCHISALPHSTLLRATYPFFNLLVIISMAIFTRDVVRSASTLAMLLLLMLIFHSEGGRTLERHAVFVLKGSSTKLKHQHTNKSFQPTGNEEPLGYLPPTNPGSSPSIGHHDIPGIPNIKT